MKQLSFKMRIALFTGIIVLITSLSLTLISMYNAKKQIDFITLSIDVPNTEHTDAHNGVIYSVTSEQSASTEIDITDSTDLSNLEVPVQRYTIQADKASKRFNMLSIAAMIVIAAAGMAGAYLFAGKSLKPIQELSTTTMSITENNLDMRLPPRGTKDEISALTNSFNSMLDRLSDAFEQQKRFSANAAHEFKTPVAVIKTGLQTLMLDDTAGIEDYQEVFEIISRNSKRLADIVDDLLTLTNKDAEFSLETVSVSSMLTDIVRDLMPKYRIKEVDVEYNFDDEVFIKCPETLTYRLFANLIENAFKYNKQGGSIKITVKTSDYGCDVSICDSGIGIPENDMPYIWNSFYCVDTSRSKNLGGTGLGLSVAKEIADRFGWELNAVSILGEGSEFTVKCKNITD